MLTLDHCIQANRPILFIVAESELEVLQYLNDNYKKNEWFVYSSTITNSIPLKDLLKNSFSYKGKSSSTMQVLSSIHSKTFEVDNNRFDKHIFLDCQTYIHDNQNIRKIKDIVTRYQMNDNYTMNLIFVSQDVNVPPALERLSEVVFFDLPDDNEIRKVCERVVKKLELSKKYMPTAEIVNNMKGLTLFEIEQAILQSFQLYKKVELKFIREFKKSAIAKTNMLSLMESDLGFKDIGGMENLKAWIKKSYGGWTVEGREFGLPLLKGLLLVGLPGTGKSLIMKTMGQEWGLPVVAFDPAMIFSSRVGDSESNMRRVLKTVEDMSPCILCIDEIEKGFAGMQSSSYSDSGVTARVIGSFLVWMQECEKPVFIVATANNIQSLPPELINRFDETFFVNLPEHRERQDIFSIHIEKLSRKVKDFNIPELATESKRLSGREIEQTLKEAMYNAFQSDEKKLTTEIILDVLKKKTNLLTTMAEQLNYLLEWVGWDEDKKDGIRARYANLTDTLDMGQVKNEIDDILKSVENPDKDL